MTLYMHKRRMCEDIQEIGTSSSREQVIIQRNRICNSDQVYDKQTPRDTIPIHLN